MLRGGLQDAGLTDPHAHVFVHNRFSLGVVRRKRQGVFVDTVEELTDVIELFATGHVRKEHFSETAGFERSQTLFSTIYVTKVYGLGRHCISLCRSDYIITHTVGPIVRVCTEMMEEYNCQQSLQRDLNAHLVRLGHT